MQSTERKRRGQSPESAAAAAAVASVLGDDDLLVEILLRLDFPTCLVRAALICRRWLRHASDPAFLRRFRALHPPRILGIHVEGGGYPIRFIPVPQPPELAVAMGRAAGALRDSIVYDCRNGRLLVRTKSRIAVRSLLQPGPDKPLPTLPGYIRALYLESRLIHSQHRLLFEDDGDATSCLLLNLSEKGVKFGASFSILQAGVWGVAQSAVTELQQGTPDTVLGHKLLLGSKVYMVTSA